LIAPEEPNLSRKMNYPPKNPHRGGRRLVKDVTPMGLLGGLCPFFLLRFSLAEATFFNAFNLFAKVRSPKSPLFLLFLLLS